MKLWTVILSCCALLFAGQALISPLHQSLGGEEGGELLAFLALCLVASYSGGFLSAGYQRWRFGVAALAVIAALCAPLVLGASPTLIPLTALIFSGAAGLILSALLTLSPRGAFASTFFAFPLLLSPDFEPLSPELLIPLCAPFLFLPVLFLQSQTPVQEVGSGLTRVFFKSPAGASLRLTRASLLGTAAWILCLNALGAGEIAILPELEISLRPELLFGGCAFIGALCAATPHDWSAHRRSLLGLFTISFALLIAGESPFSAFPLALQSLAFGYTIANLPLSQGRFQPRALVLLLPFTLLLLSLGLPLNALILYRVMLLSCVAVTLSLLVERKRNQVLFEAAGAE